MHVAGEQLVAVYPQIFFFIPTMSSFKLPDVDEELPDSSVGVLWLAVLLEQENCRKLGELRRIFNHWWPQHSPSSAKSGFVRFKERLLHHHLLEEVLGDSDRREHWFRVTDKGHRVMENVIAERTRVADAMLKTLPPELANEVVAVAEKVAPLLWKRLRQRIRVL